MSEDQGKRKKHFAVIYNTYAQKGKAVDLVKQVATYLDDKKITFESFKNDLPLQPERFDCLLVIGGDGTFHYVLNQLGMTQVPFTFIKCGTGNDFFHHLFGKKSTLKQQLETACDDNFQKIDIGKCNGRFFLNGVGIGFDGEVVLKSTGKRYFKGHFAYLSTVLLQLFVYREKAFRISVDDSKLEDSYFMLSIANGSTYGGGFQVAPNANMQDGYFEFSGVRKISLHKRIRYLPVIEKGQHLTLPFIDYKKCKSVHVITSEPVSAHLDGELLVATEFQIEMYPQAITIKNRVKR